MRTRSTLFAALTAVTAAVGVLAPASPASAAVTNGRIAYIISSDGAGVPLIWTANPDGTDRRQLLVDARDFRWSPDGTRVAFVQSSPVNGNYTLYTAAANLTGRRSFGRSDAVDWTADGTGLVMTRQLANGNRELFLQPAAGGTGTRLTRVNDRGCSVEDVDVRGSTVAYQVSCAGTDGSTEVRTATLTGTSLTADTLRLRSIPDPVDPKLSFRIDQARIRANGRLVITGCLAPATCPITAAANLYELNGTTLTRLTALAPGAGGGFRGLAPSPVGNQLAVGLRSRTANRVLVRPTGTVIDPLGELAVDWQPLLAP